MNTLSLEIRGVSKEYNGKAVLKGCSLSFEKGLINAVIGPNGSGKTTLVRICSLLDSPSEGKVLFTDSDAHLENSVILMRRITMVFHRPSLFNASVEKNVLYGLKMRGINKGVAGERVKKALEMVGFWELRDHNALTLSAGGSQRVALARAFVIEPEILFLDEPTSNLDPGNVTIIEEIIKEINKTFGTTIILVTQNMFQARRLADKIILLLNGEIVEYSDVNDFFNKPKDERALRFINGEMVY